ncbi:RIB43A-domain-containing protein [Gonapodya prolifera JEL478]|uniref:RIB43A-domain-containing protein n=1 Tax=Gonapodya prolifera (strain JEL478) TaxID=1344416 RepID=A0A139AVU1_GONPJ|nr:RIB43A-domain-containing protein [Gonapodya prolifera JEL478]|eukprot:KXS20827.1 RIB43A-domain-containing protein [Gonapodya prolifera JEL478]
MYKVEIVTDSLQDQAIMRRRMMDEERKRRFFNPKIRVLGNDVQTLEEQIKMKKELQALDKQREMEMATTQDQNLITAAAIVDKLTAEAARVRRVQLGELNQFRLTKQTFDNRREFHLNDPHAIRKDAPPRATPDGSGCPVSGLQAFQGEDLKERNRLALQREQMRVWTMEQTAEKERKKREDEEQKRKEAEYQSAVLQEMEAQRRADDDARARRAREDQEMNKRLADDKRKREQSAKSQELAQNSREIEGWLRGEFLTESAVADPDVEGPHHIRIDMFKGMNDEKRRQVREFQQQQRIESEMRRQHSLREQQEWAQYSKVQMHVTAVMEEAERRKGADIAARIAEENAKKAAEDRLRRQQDRQAYFSNRPTDAFFAQFNNTPR